ncbi:gluconate 2-dehydrogenase subunit 3 family protein [Sporosarcina sp. PTS2304]|uniref:gluconate 2-dehydrogenase subunit 3 family protein n=1 Tax=Sporosarcina sp. PTS2304 TaxID=2283194 RepID=UPI0013B40A9A|nr:gluconate 2-dehydrogenase subunit 3 family protein [Sporosarcina sp. PTS2304]
MQNKKSRTRRNRLTTTGIATGALVGGGLIGGLVVYNSRKSKEGVKKDKIEQEVGTYGQMFFSNIDEFNTLSAVIERMFPECEIGSGVSYFIDNQLIGNYGSDAEKFTEDSGLSLTRGEIFRQGIKKLEEEANQLFGKQFVELEEEQMDRIVALFQKNEVEMTGVTSEVFVNLLRSAVVKGMNADPTINGKLTIEELSENPSSLRDAVESDKTTTIERQPVGSVR